MLPDDRDAAHLWNMARRARYLVQKSGRITVDELTADEDHQYAVFKAMELIWESARKLSETFRAAHPEIPWNAIKGMRNVLVHEYDRVLWPRVWETMTVSIPALLLAIEPLLPDVPPGETDDNPL